MDHPLATYSSLIQLMNFEEVKHQFSESVSEINALERLGFASRNRNSSARSPVTNRIWLDDQKVWIRAAATTEAETDRLKEAHVPEIVFFTDPVAGGYIGSVYCIVVKDDGTKEWQYCKFGRIDP